jgi:hypothetical protein
VQINDRLVKIAATLFDMHRDRVMKVASKHNNCEHHMKAGASEEEEEDEL